MAFKKDTLIYFNANGHPPPQIIAEFSKEQGMMAEALSEWEEVHSAMNRSFPACVVLDARAGMAGALDLCRLLKGDPFTAIVPVVMLCPEGDDGAASASMAAEGLVAGADEVLTDLLSERERTLRLALVLRRAERDVAVHPTTRLPGTVQIERDVGRRMVAGGLFAVCYADLDHFKEFNDRYGYNHGDAVILLLSRILRDIVRALSSDGFVGHIGGDDFIFTAPLEDLEECCDEIILLFDELIPYQYTEEDREAGYFLGKDRRGSVHRIPLMTLSIGVVTNQNHEFIHTAQVSELSAEMKSYAKTLPGSLYVVDRREPFPEEEEDDSTGSDDTGESSTETVELS